MVGSMALKTILFDEVNLAGLLASCSWCVFVWCTVACPVCWLIFKVVMATPVEPQSDVEAVAVHGFLGDFNEILH